MSYAREFSSYPTPDTLVKAGSDWNALVDHGLVKTASYIIRLNGANYEAINGNTGKIDYSNVSATVVIQGAIDTAHAAGGGFIQAKEVAVPDTGLTHYSDVLIHEMYQGNQREFRVLDDGNLIKLGLQYGIIARPCIPMWHAKMLNAVNLRDSCIQEILRYDCTSGTYNTELYFPATIGYGTYEWKAKITTPAANRWQYVGFAEEACSQWRESIFVWHNGTNYYFETNSGGAQTQTNLVGEDWTTEKTFKVIWGAGEAKLYVDDVLKATNNAGVPSIRLVVFQEIQHNAAQAANTYVYGRDWRKL